MSNIDLEGEKKSKDMGQKLAMFYGGGEWWETLGR
jgi:hypothetical protein